MFKHKIHEKADFKTYFGWLMLSFLAGNVNTGGFLSAQTFVSHVTGFATLSGISLERGYIMESLGFLTIPAFFLGGVMLSGYLTEKQSAKSHGQKFAPVMGLVAAILGVVSLFGYVGWFGQFGSAANLEHDYFLLALLCGACGLQNAAITSATGSTIRTTHLTGLTTDLGLGLIRAEVYPQSNEQKAADRHANKLRLLTVIAFTLGSAVGAFMYIRFHYLGFLLPMCIAIYAAWDARK